MATPTSNDSPRQTLPESEIHHDPEGKSTAAWAGSLICLLGFFLGALALPLDQPWLFWVAVVIVVLGAITGKVLTNMGYGVGGSKWKAPQH